MKNNTTPEHLLDHIGASFLMEANDMMWGYLLEPDAVDRARQVYLDHRPRYDAMSVSVISDPDWPYQPPRRLEVVTLGRYEYLGDMYGELARLYRACPYVQINCDGSGGSGVRSWRILPQDGGGSGGLSRAVAVICCEGMYYPILITEACRWVR